MKKIFSIIIVLLWFGFLFFFEGQTPPPTQSTLSLQSSSGQTASGVSQVVSAKVAKILADSDVQTTLKRIEQDRPKYRQDGATFMNRENLLPVQKDQAYYHEWTVETSGSVDRWARRIIEGKKWELYFTDDHYISFVRVK